MDAATDLIDLASLFTEEERLIAETVRRFVREQVLPIIDEHYEAATFPSEIIKGLGELGVFGMDIPEEGEPTPSATAYGLVCMELEAGDSGLRSFASVQSSLAMHAIHSWGTEAQKKEWLPGMRRGELLGCFCLTEPDSGSDPGSMRTNARRDGSDWVLNGSKLWITNGSVADVAIVWARTDAGIRGFLVPTATKGFAAAEIHHKLSMRASVTAAVSFDDCRLPAEALLEGAEGLKGPLSCLNEARFGIVFGAPGAARTCLEVALDYAGTRQQFGRPLASFQLTQAKLADMTAAYSTSVLLAAQIGRLKERGALRPEQISLGKLHNVKSSLEVARTARSLLGANGITLDYQVMRHLSNLETVLTYEGTHEVHQLSVGRALTGVSAFA